MVLSCRAALFLSEEKGNSTNYRLPYCALVFFCFQSVNANTRYHRIVSFHFFLVYLSIFFYLLTFFILSVVVVVTVVCGYIFFCCCCYCWYYMRGCSIYVLFFFVFLNRTKEKIKRRHWMAINCCCARCSS